MPLPHALIHSVATQSVSEANALELAAGNHQWHQVSQHLVNLHQMNLQIAAALEELSTPPSVQKEGEKESSIMPRSLPVTGIEMVREAFGMPDPAKAKAKEAEESKKVGQVATAPSIVKR